MKPLADMQGSLMAHVRYPEDLFQVQRYVLGRYHVSNATSWYQTQNSWRPPSEPDRAVDDAAAAALLPDDAAAAAVQLRRSRCTRPTSRTRRRRTSSNNLTGYLAVDADAGSTAGTPRADYGKLRLLVLPANTNVAGPGQEQTLFNAQAQSEIALLERGSTKVTRGNLLTLPEAGGLLYVQPVYVTSNSETSTRCCRRCSPASAPRSPSRTRSTRR